jgi:hypothetical protein
MSKINQNQIVYYLGAGASAQAIPVIDGLTPRLGIIADHLMQYISGQNVVNTLPKKYPELLALQGPLNTIINDLNWLCKEAQNHQTVDTLARKFYLIGDPRSLCRLKRTLISYFFLEQTCIIQDYNEVPTSQRSILDLRYDNLIASIAYKNGSDVWLKGHIKVITWNYDLQLELAIKNYKDLDLNQIRSFYNIYPNENVFRSDSSIDSDIFSCLKLNGTAIHGNLHYDAETVYDLYINRTDLNQAQIVIKYLEWFNENLNSEKALNPLNFETFNFAWEGEGYKYKKFKNYLNEYKQILVNSRVLIIVGYSFPYFNSEIDKELLSVCNPEEIIIQDSNPVLIKERLLELCPHLSVDKNNSNSVKIKLLKPDKYFPIHRLT